MRHVPDVLNGKRSPVENSVTCGTKVRYTCNEGFRLEGDIALECGVGGQLLGQIPVCRSPVIFILTLVKKGTKLIQFKLLIEFLI